MFSKKKYIYNFAIYYFYFLSVSFLKIIIVYYY